MTTRTGIVEAFATTPYGSGAPFEDSEYFIKIKPDSGRDAVSFSGVLIGQTYKKGDKVTYYETAAANGEMRYTL